MYKGQNSMHKTQKRDLIFCQKGPKRPPSYPVVAHIGNIELAGRAKADSRGVTKLVQLFTATVTPRHHFARRRPGHPPSYPVVAHIGNIELTGRAKADSRRVTKLVQLITATVTP